MKWSVDTHKYMSEITRTALKIMTDNNVTSTSDSKHIEKVEHLLADAKVYKDYGSAEGRIRRALFTYFKAYGCLDDLDHLTQMGEEFANNKVTIQEFSLWYLLNYQYSVDSNHFYYPLHFILKFMNILEKLYSSEIYICLYDFFRISNCNSIEEINEEFIKDVISKRTSHGETINERTIGFDVWTKMLVQSGLFVKENKKIFIEKKELAKWILDEYDRKNITVNKGDINTGVLKDLPNPNLEQQVDFTSKVYEEYAAINAYLFENIDNRVIEKYIIINREFTLDRLLSSVGLNSSFKGFYRMFNGYEHLIAFHLILEQNHSLNCLGNIILNTEIYDIENDSQLEVSESEMDENERSTGGCNILLYGVPGAGKSYKLNTIIKDSPYERVVFHPDYTYSDFAGQIMPKLVALNNGEKKLSYNFVEGPFTKALKKAEETNKMFYLIIEEINRGNAAAIFGDLFQLLDRNTYGESEYSISNYDIAESVYGDEHHRIRIPSNLTILATMNTADQNIFTLDTAFQRRWEMKYIKNDVLNAKHASCFIEGSKLSWAQFATIMNKKIVSYGAELSISEDKQLGAYFARETDLSHEKFPEKILKYLWDDVFKLERERIFKSNVKAMDDLVTIYNNAFINNIDPLNEILVEELYGEMESFSFNLESNVDEIQIEDDGFSESNQIGSENLLLNKN